MSKTINQLNDDKRHQLYLLGGKMSNLGVVANCSLTYDGAPLHIAEKKIKDVVDAATELLHIVQEIVDDPEY